MIYMIAVSFFYLSGTRFCSKTIFLLKAGVAMKIILKYILTNIKERKLRTAVMFLSVLLSSMLLFVSFSIGASYESAQQKMAWGMAGCAVLSVRAADRAVGTD